MNYVVQSATEADIDEAAATLAVAFVSYPWTRWCLPEADYDSRLLRLQSIYLSHALQHGMILITPNRDGVAALLPPNAPEPSESVQLEIAEIMGDRVQEVFGLVLPPRSIRLGILRLLACDLNLPGGAWVLHSSKKHCCVFQSLIIDGYRLRRQLKAMFRCTSVMASRSPIDQRFRVALLFTRWEWSCSSSRL